MNLINIVPDLLKAIQGIQCAVADIILVVKDIMTGKTVSVSSDIATAIKDIQNCITDIETIAKDM